MGNMDTLSKATRMIDAIDSPSDDVQEKENLFKPMVPEAKSYLRSIMLNGRDVKLGISIAQDILDRAGEVKKQDTRAAIVINITDSQINLLAQGAKEVEEASNGPERAVN